MNAITPYLTFDGTCKDAMTFYAKCLGAELDMTDFSHMPGDFSPEAKQRILHARLSRGNAVLMASDSLPGAPLQKGTNFSVSLACESVQDIETLFTAFSDGAQVTMPLQDVFWGARFGMLTDQFGVKWMFNFDYPKQG